MVGLMHDDVVGWAESMVPKLAGRANEAERLRALPQATIDDCEAIDIWSMVIPASRGGHGLGMRTLCEMAATLAHGCASTAWTVSFLTLHNWFVLKAPGDVQEAVFDGRRSVRMATPLAPGGEAIPVVGGHRVSGRWQWATGIQHADLVSIAAFVPREGGRPTARVFFLRVDEIDIVDVWHTSGMRGTGSNDVVARDLFVPEHRSMPFEHLRGDDPPGFAVHPDPFIRYPMSSVLC